MIDGTGVGRAVVDMFRKARPRAAIRPITITAGNAVSRDAGWHVPKKELVSVLRVLLSSRRLHVVPTLPLAAVLVKNLRRSRRKSPLPAMRYSRRGKSATTMIASLPWRLQHGLPSVAYNLSGVASVERLSVERTSH